MKNKNALITKIMEADPSDSFDMGYHLYAKEKHKKRVLKTPARIKYAIEQFQKNNIAYQLKNEEIGHFHCWRESDGRLFQLWAGTGKILDYNKRGIDLLIRELRKGQLTGYELQRVFRKHR